MENGFYRNGNFMTISLNVNESLLRGNVALIEAVEIAVFAPQLQ